MSDEILEARRKGLEEEFFARHNARLRARLRERAQAMAEKEALAKTSGIADDAVLDHLLGLGVSAETVAAFSLAPLVAVAWADGRIDTKERDAVLAAVREVTGCEAGDEPCQLVESWLRREPPARQLEVWTEYTTALMETLDPEARAAFRGEVLGRARRVAQATGGFLGLGRRISKSEADVLREMERAFD